MLYRVFPYAPGTPVGDDGGALFVPRELQGTGRHDNPSRYGALYLSRDPAAAVAERLQRFRGRTIGPNHLRRADGRAFALAAIDDEALDALVDLDDPSQLLQRGLRPSCVATSDRTVTQPIALAIFEARSQGLQWWSTLEALWTNVTLFAERCVADLRVAQEPEPLTLASALVRRVATRLGVAVTA